MLTKICCNSIQNTRDSTNNMNNDMNYMNTSKDKNKSVLIDLMTLYMFVNILIICPGRANDWNCYCYVENCTIHNIYPINSAVHRFL